MRVTASTSSPLVSPTSGLSTAPAKWPARVSRSSPATRAYSWARCSGLRVWKATTRCQPLCAEQRPRLARRQDELAVFGMLGLRQHAHLAAEQVGARVVLHHAAAGMVAAVGAVDALDVVLACPRRTRLVTSREPTTSSRPLTRATVWPGLSVAACSADTGKASGMVQAYFLPSWTMTSSSRTRSKVALSIGPVSGLRPPSPRR